MANVRVLVRLRYEGTEPTFYDISSRVNYEELRWEGNSEGTSANCSLSTWTILPKSQNSYVDYAGATIQEKIAAAIADESFLIEIPNKAEIRVVDSSQSPIGVLFAGIITRISTEKSGGYIKQSIECADNTALLEEHIIADYYAPRDSRDIDIINGGTSNYTVASVLPGVMGTIDGVSVTSEPTGGNLSDGTYYIRMQPISSKLVGRDGAYPQYAPATSQTKIILSAGTSTQRIKVLWKNAYLGTTHNIHVAKDLPTSTEYLAKSVNTITDLVQISGASRSNNVVSVETKTPHGLFAGDPVVVSIPQSSGFSVERKDCVVVDSVQSATKFKYKNTGDDGSASIVGGTVGSGSFAYINSLNTSGAPVTVQFQSPRGWGDGEVYHLSTATPGEEVADTHNGYYDGSYFRLGVNEQGIRGWIFPPNIFGGLFDKDWLEEAGLNIRDYVQPVDTQYRFSPYFSESDTPNAEQFGGRTLRDALDYISSKTGGEYWIDRGYYDSTGQYHCNLHYRSKSTDEMVHNGVYDGTTEGWTFAGGFVLSNAFTGPYGSGYVAYSEIPESYVEQSEDKRASVVAGEKFFISVRGKASDHQNRWGAYVDWYDTSGAKIHSDHLGNLPQAGVWGRVWKIITAPNNAVKAGLRGVCQDQQNGFAYFTDWSMVLLTGSMGYGDFEDTASYPVPIYEMEVPQSPVESGGSANRLHLYAVFRTKDSNGDKIALLDAEGNPVQYVDYDFTPGIWATNGKIIEAAITDERVETLEDAELSAAAYWKENGLPIESYTFEMRPRDAYDAIYPVPEVGQVIPFIWSTLGVAKPLIVKSVVGAMQGTNVIYSITVGGDIRLQRSSFIRLSEKIRELADVNPIPDTPDAPEDLSAVSNDKAISLSWSYNETSEVNKNIASFEVQRQDGIFKAISSIAKTGATVQVNTDGSHGLVQNDTVRIDLNTANEALIALEGQWTVASTTTTSFTYTAVDTTTNVTETSIDGWAYYNYSEFKVVQNSKATYVTDSGLYPALQYRYKVRSLSSDNTASPFTKPTEPISPQQSQATVADGSVTLEKLQSTLRPIVIISDETLPDLNPNGLSAYPEGTIVYHLGGTPPGLRRAERNEANSPQWAWVNAVTGSDIVSNTITSEKISTVGLDASLIKSGQLTIDNRFGLSSNKNNIIARSRAGGQATIYTPSAHGISSGTIDVSGLDESAMNGSYTFKDSQVLVSHRQRAGNKATLRTTYKHAMNAGDNIQVSSVDAAFDGGPYAIDTVHSNIVAKQKIGVMATISTDNAHGFAVNDTVTITGADVPFNASDQAQATILGTSASVQFKQHNGTNAMLTTQYAHGYRSGDTVVTSGNSAPYDGTFTVNGTSVPINYPARIEGVATVRTSVENPVQVNDGVSISGMGAPYDGTFSVSHVSAPVYSYQATGRSYALSHVGRVGNRVIARTSAAQTIAANDVLTTSGISTTALNKSSATVLSAGESITGYQTGIGIEKRRNGNSGAITAVSMNDSAGKLSAAGSVVGRATGRSINYFQVATGASSSTITLFTGKYGATTAYNHYMTAGEKISVRNLTVTIGGQSRNLSGQYTIASVSASSFTFTVPTVYPNVSKTAVTGTTACVVGEYAEVMISQTNNFPTSTAANPSFNDMPVMIVDVGANYDSFNSSTPTNKFYLPPSGKSAQQENKIVRIHVANATPSTSGRFTTSTTTGTVGRLTLGTVQVTDTWPVYEFNGTASSTSNGFTTVTGGSISNGLALITSASALNSGAEALAVNQQVKISGISDARFNVTTKVASLPTSTTAYVDLPYGTKYTGNLISQSGRITNGVVTLETPSAHGFSVGNNIAVGGITAQAAYNGLFTVFSVPSNVSFTYKVPISSSQTNYSSIITGEGQTGNSLVGSVSDGRITYTTANANGFMANDSVVISGISDSHNGTFTVFSGTTINASPISTFTIKKALDADLVIETVTGLSGFAYNGKTFSYETATSGVVNFATTTGVAETNEATIVTTIPHGLIKDDTVVISGITSTGSSLNGTYQVARDGIRISSVSNNLGQITVTCASPHGFIVGDPVSMAGVSSGIDGNYTVSSISQVSGSGNPDVFVVTRSNDTAVETITPTDGNASNGKTFRLRTNAPGASAIAYAVAAAGTVSSGKTFSYTTTGSSGYLPKTIKSTDGSADNGRVFSFAVASSALSRAASTGSADNYKTFRYQVATSGFVPPTEVLPLGSGIAKNYQTLTYTIAGSSLLGPTASPGYFTNGRVIRYDKTGTSSLAYVSNAEVSQRLSTSAITSPNFTVDYTGNVTAGSLTITGGSIDLGSGAFTVSNGGSVNASDISISGGGIDLGNGTFSVDNAGAVTASDITVTGGSLSIGSNFDVTNDGVMTAVGAVMQNVNLNPSGAPALYVSASGTEGDFAVPSGENVTFGEWNGTALTRNMVLDNTGNLTIRGTYSDNDTFSDKTYKKNISAYTIDPSAIDRINIYSFEWDLEKVKSDGYFTPSKDGVHIGVIAQEVAEAIPSAMTPRSKESIAGINIYQITYALISSLKETRSRLAEAESRIAELENMK